MKIDFVDFVPEMIDKGGIFKAPTMEEMVEVVRRMNEWIERNQTKVVNVETVVLPNIHQAHEEGSQDTQVRTSGDFPASWHQFVRVWYEKP